MTAKQTIDQILNGKLDQKKIAEYVRNMLYSGDKANNYIKYIIESNGKEYSEDDIWIIGGVYKKCHCCVISVKDESINYSATIFDEDGEASSTTNYDFFIDFNSYHLQLDIDDSNLIDEDDDAVYLMKACISDEKTIKRYNYPFIVREDPILIANNKSDFHLSYLYNRKRASQILVSGPPGSGKSNLVDKYFCPILTDGKSDKNCERVVFSKATFYEDIWGSIKPVKNEENIIYQFIPGSFVKILLSALESPKEVFVYIIEEINRGDTYTILRELYQLMDRDETGKSRFWISLPREIVGYLISERENYYKEITNYLGKKQSCNMIKFFNEHIYLEQINNSIEEYEKTTELVEGLLYGMIKLPRNLFIFATMNSADSGVTYLDQAIKRRFYHIVIDERGNIYGADKIVKVLSLLPNNDRSNNNVQSTSDMCKEDKDEVVTKNEIQKCNKEIKKEYPDKLLSLTSFDEKMSEVPFNIQLAIHMTQNVKKPFKNHKTVLSYLRSLP